MSARTAAAWSRDSTLRIACCWYRRPRPDNRSKSRSSGSTDRSPIRRKISFFSARRASSSSRSLASTQCAGDRRETHSEQTLEVTPQNQFFCDAPEDSKRCRERQDVGHLRAIAFRLEKVIVDERLERAALHRILEISRAIEGRDARGELLRDAEMARAPGDLFTHADEPRRFARDRFFVRVRHRLHVQIEIARRVEATL